MGTNGIIPIKVKVENILKEKEQEIITFFNMYQQESKKPNNMEILTSDNPIIKTYNPSENKYNIYMDIFNMPALFRLDNGLSIIINKISILFDLFFTKINEKHLSEKEINDKFIEFYQSMLEANTKKIKDFIKEDISEDELLGIKEGMENLSDYFGIENIKNFYIKLFSEGGGAIVGGIIGASTILAVGGNLAAGICLGASMGIMIGVIGYFVFRNLKLKNQSQFIDKNQKIIKRFFEDIKDFSKEKFNKKNLFVLAIEKENNNIKDFYLTQDI